MFTFPASKSARARMKLLLTRARAVAERLPPYVEHYRSGAVARPQKRLQTALVEERLPVLPEPDERRGRRSRPPPQ